MLTLLRHFLYTFQTPLLYLAYTHQTPSRYVSDTHPKTWRHTLHFRSWWEPSATFSLPLEITRHLQDLIQKISNPFPETLQTTSRHPLDFSQTPSRHHTDTLKTLQTPSRNLQLHFHTTKSCCSQISSNPSGGGGGGGGWVVYRYIIMPLRGPTCKMVLARIQFRLNSKLDPSVAILPLHLPDTFKTPSSPVQDSLKKPSRHISDHKKFFLDTP